MKKYWLRSRLIAGSRVRLGIFFKVLFAVSVFVSCEVSGGTSAPTGNGIALTPVPARTTGVAPLSVFFDASGTTDTSVTTRPFHDLEYRWNFGDARAGTWANGAQPGTSKNLATGPVAAHVFETPGTYTVSVTALDGKNSATTSTTITVQDPDAVFSGTKTTCVGATSTPVQGQGGCPAGANTAVQPSFPAAIASYALTSRRVLFKRGDTFTATSFARIATTGPGIVGAFGTGAKPRVQMTGNTSILLMSSTTTPDIKDWRVMDLELDGLSAGLSEGIQGDGNINQLTILRVDAHDLHFGFDFSGSILNWWNTHGHPGHGVYDQLSIVDSSMLRAIGGTGGYGAFIVVQRLSFLGNLLDDTTAAEHVVRLSFVAGGLLSNNTLAHAASTKEIIKLHGPTWVSGVKPVVLLGSGAYSDGYTEKVIFSDNKFVGGINPWSITVGPQNDFSDERVRDVIFERNWWTAGTGTQTHILVMSVETTLRNNIFDLTGGRWHEGVFVEQWGPGHAAPPPDNERIYNNTFYSGSTNDFVPVHLDPTAAKANVSVINNLGSAPAATKPIMISGTSTGLIQSNNLFVKGEGSPAPLFVSATPSVPADFGLSVSSPARDKGASGVSAVPVFSDFLLCVTCRPQSGVTGVIDIGAIEGP